MRGLLAVLLLTSLSFAGVPTGRACAPVERSCCCSLDDEAPPESRVDGACCCVTVPAGAAVARRTDVDSPRVERAVAVAAARVAGAAARGAFVAPPGARPPWRPMTLVSARILLLC